MINRMIFMFHPINDNAAKNLILLFHPMIFIINLINDNAAKKVLPDDLQFQQIKR